MRVALDVANFFGGLTNGSPIYLFNLVKALVREDEAMEVVLLYHHRLSPGAAEVLRELEGPRVRILRPGTVRTGVPRGGWWFPYHPAINRFAGRIDVFHGGDFFRPRPDGTPVVVTVHDLSTLVYPEHHTLLNRLRDRWKLRWTKRVAHRVIADSASTRDDLVDYLGFDGESIDVVPLARGHAGADASPTPEAELRRRFRLDGPYILTVGTIEPRKNHLGLIRAFEAVSKDFPNALLVIAGGQGWKSEPVVEAVDASPVRDRIRLTGFVQPEELQALYGGCAAFAYPSLYEGFGLPVLEAMARGAPVLTAAASSTTEVAGDAALLVDPRSGASIADGLRRLLGSPSLQRQLSERGRERERTFTWQRTARLTILSYAKAMTTAGSG